MYDRLPQDLITYLTNLIGAPGLPGVYFRDLDQVEWSGLADNSLTGVLTHGTPTGEQAAELMRVMMPGAHLFLVAPDEEPTGHTGACLIEDTGFEIRDAILLVQGESRVHYVPKAARSEREAGCARLPAKAGFEAVEREEGSAGVNNPRAGAGRTAVEVHNFHPTVKPIDLMERLLQGVPQNGPVLDPFMGSGSTGVACSRTGHDFVGIEREAEYLAIADARIRHWDGQKNLAREPAQIVSDAPPAPEPSGPVSLDDIFGWNDE